MPKLTAQYELSIDGVPLGNMLDAPSDLFDLSYEDNLLLADAVTWRLIDDKIRYVDRFKEGMEVRLRLGWWGETLEDLFTGRIAAIEPDFPEDGAPSLTIQAYDLSFPLRQVRRTKTWQNVKDSQIAQKIAQANGLKAVVEDSRTVHDYVAQTEQTDMEFLQERARAIGYEVTVKSNTLYFRRPQKQDAVLKVTYREGLLHFRPRKATARTKREVLVRGWDPKNKRPFVAKAGDTAAKEGRVSVVTRPVATQAEADQLANATAEEVSLNYITGEGAVEGEPTLKAGRLIEITGIGEEFSGTYYLTLVRHKPTQGYICEFEARNRVVLE